MEVAAFGMARGRAVRLRSRQMMSARPPKPEPARARRPPSGDEPAGLRGLLNAWNVEKSPAAVVSLGAKAFEALLALEGKSSLFAGQSESEARDFEDARRGALAAFARADPSAVLQALVARGWSPLRIALSGVGQVPDARVLPYLLEAMASKEPLDRCAVIPSLALHHDEKAQRALVAALSDRSTSVRAAAIEALGDTGDPSAIEPLRLAAKKNAGRPWLAQSAEAALKRIRRKKAGSPASARGVRPVAAPTAVGTFKTCEHLAPLEWALAKRKIALKPIASPYDDDNRWFGCNCTFDEKALRARLGLQESVRYIEYDGRVAGSDATFMCERCHAVIMGLHPDYAPPRAPRLS